MNTDGFHDEGRLSVTVDALSVEGGLCEPKPGYPRQDLLTLFAMRDLGMSGVAGGRRVEPLSLEREARVAGSAARGYAGNQPPKADRPQSSGWPRPRTVALQDGLRITFSSADRLMEET